MTPPRTRWSLAETGFYGTRFADMIARGDDVDGEARLADALLERGSRVIDAGAGMGRVGAALRNRGHEVLAVEPDATLVAQARATYPDLTVRHSDILELDADRDGDADLIVAVGNVMLYLAADTERDVLARFRELLAPRGRVLVGFHLTDDPPPGARASYLAAEFEHDVATAGLAVAWRSGSYDLRPYRPESGYGVWLLTLPEAA